MASGVSLPTSMFPSMSWPRCQGVVERCQAKNYFILTLVLWQPSVFHCFAQHIKFLIATAWVCFARFQYLMLGNAIIFPTRKENDIE